MGTKTHFDLTTIYNDLKDGMYPSQIARKYKVTKQAVDYYIQKLKKGGFIRKLSYGIWAVNTDKQLEVKQFSDSITPSGYPPPKVRSKKEVRGHGFNFTAEVPTTVKRWQDPVKRRKLLAKKNIEFYEIGNAYWKGEGFMFAGRKVHFTPRSIQVFWPEGESVFADRASDARTFALMDWFDFIEKLEGLVGFSLRVKGNYAFRVGQEHYALLNHPVAVHHREKKVKLQIRGHDGLVFLIADYSFNVDEFEAIKVGEAVSDSEGVQRLFNKLKDYDYDLQHIIKLQLTGLLDEVMNPTKKRPDDSIKRLSDYDSERMFR